MTDGLSIPFFNISQNISLPIPATANFIPNLPYLPHMPGLPWSARGVHGADGAQVSGTIRSSRSARSARSTAVEGVLIDIEDGSMEERLCARCSRVIETDVDE